MDTVREMWSFFGGVALVGLVFCFFGQRCNEADMQRRNDRGLLIVQCVETGRTPAECENGIP